MFFPWARFLFSGGMAANEVTKETGDFGDFWFHHLSIRPFLVMVVIYT